MSETASTSRNIAMKGAGYYSKATTGAKDVIDGAAHLIFDAIDALDLSGDGPITVADMGCADGGTSMNTMAQALKRIRERAPDRPIQMVYTDVHFVVAEGNFVLTASEGTFADKPTAFYDLFRVEDGMIVEHWDVISDIPSEMAHDNGKF